MINVTQTDYCFPTTIPKSYFHGKKIPSFQDWQRYNHIHFLRYLWYLLDQNFNKPYPSYNRSHIPDEDLLKEIDDLVNKIRRKLSSSNGNRPIKKILIGEAPPCLPLQPAKCNYFYHAGPWPQKPGPWINAPKKCMFPNKTYISKDLFLQNCAKQGFLLLDLFPYAIKFTTASRKKPEYKAACKLAFSNVPYNKYSINIIKTLDQLKNQVANTFAIGFGMKLLGECILNDKPGCVHGFSKWISTLQFSLIKGSPIDAKRITCPPNLKKPSGFLRVISDGSGNPNPTLLNVAGF